MNPIPQAVPSTNVRQAMDSDSTDDKIVLNRIVSLKEDAGK